MIFQHTIDKVLSGEKTQTRRIVKPGDELIRVPRGAWQIKHWAVMRNGRTIFSVTQPRAVQAGRGIVAEGRICITDIRREDVRQISDADILAEGFERKVEFFDTWCRLHDKGWYRRYLEGTAIHAHMPSPVVLPAFCAALACRPAAAYDAWVISFYTIGVCK